MYKPEYQGLFSPLLAENLTTFGCSQITDTPHVTLEMSRNPKAEMTG